MGGSQREDLPKIQDEQKLRLSNLVRPCLKVKGRKGPGGMHGAVADSLSGIHEAWVRSILSMNGRTT